MKKINDITKANALYIFDGCRHVLALYVAGEAIIYNKISFYSFRDDAVYESGTNIPMLLRNLYEIEDHYTSGDTVIPFELTEDEILEHILLESI